MFLKGKLSVQINKLKEVEYISLSKSFVNNYPKTECALSPKGIKVFEEYVAGIKQYIDPNP